MNKFFVPYTGDIPAAIDIKGHRLLILTSTREEMFAQLDLVGAEEIREIDVHEDGKQGETEILANLAALINGGVVLTPPGESLEALIHNLEAELPWIH